MRKLKSFALSSSGNTAIIFSLAAVPLLLAGGAAVDMVRANRAQAVLQGAADAAALGAGMADKTKPELQKLVEDYLSVNGGQNVLDTVEKIEAVRDKKTGTFMVSIEGKIKTSFMSLGGIDTMDIGAMSEVTRGSQALEIVLVLDNTDSMNAEGRLPALKESAKELVKEIFDNRSPDVYVKMGIVPFANYVNVGLASRGEPWLSVAADSTTTRDVGCRDTYPYQTWENCTEVPMTGYADGVPYTYTGYSNCQYTQGPAVQNCDPEVTHNVWRGCVGSRNSPMDTEIGSPSVPYPGIMNEYCPTALTDLSDDVSRLRGAIDGMAATGNTYIPVGLLWGWNMLNEAAPLTSAKSGAEMKALKGKKAIVLMTDGKNTMVPSYPPHVGASPAHQADDILDTLCGNIKNDDVEIYTVAFKVDDADARKLLRNCASDPSKAYDAADSDALIASFRKIAETLSAVRLSK